MNRSALCLRMLQILNSQDFITKKELAQRLETNPRNIKEFIKELETAGYSVLSTKGKYAGYYLDKRVLLPSLDLTGDEMLGLDEAVRYLSTHNDFLQYDAFRHAMEKIQSAHGHERQESSIVFLKDQSVVVGDMVKAIRVFMEAAKLEKVISFEYKSMHAKQYTKVELQPYEILNINQEYYCLGYNYQKKSFRFYKFSRVRMKNWQIMNKSFKRDADFNVHHYLGQSGLMKDELFEIECIISGDLSILIHEKGMGIEPVMEWIADKKLHVTTLVEGKLNALQLLCSLGSSVQLIRPESLKKEMKEIISDMANNYK